MRTQIKFVGGEETEFEATAEIKLSAHGVEVMERDGEDIVRVLFPWARIERVTQRGPEVAAIYTW
jgi:hypothetical protein